MISNKKFFGLALGLLLSGTVIFVAGKFADSPGIILKANLRIADEIIPLATHHTTLFVTIFDGNNPMPYAAMREPITVGSDGTLRQVVLTSDKLQVMDSSRSKPEKIRLKVRLDADGSAGPDQPGDITGQVEDIAWGSPELLVVTLDKFIKEQN